MRGNALFIFQPNIYGPKEIVNLGLLTSQASISINPTIIKFRFWYREPVKKGASSCLPVPQSLTGCVPNCFLCQPRLCSSLRINLTFSFCSYYICSCCFRDDLSRRDCSRKRKSHGVRSLTTLDTHWPSAMSRPVATARIRSRRLNIFRFIRLRDRATCGGLRRGWFLPCRARLIANC